MRARFYLINILYVLNHVFGQDSNLRGYGNNENRPIIYTFYANNPDEIRNTGMSLEDDRILLQTWKEAWEAAGWNARILGEEDAKKYKGFNDLQAVISSHVNNQYNKWCFHRWMAMIAVGGGFMADYDNFPIPSSKPFVRHAEVPNNGKLTVYEYTALGGVPSLMSGTSSEYERVLKKITKNFFDLDHQVQESKTTDMKALWDTFALNPNEYVVENKVVEGRVAVEDLTNWDQKCTRYKDAIALHFAHSAIRDGIKYHAIPENSGPQDRATHAREWIRLWVKNCGISDFVFGATIHL